jgi:GDP-L-fucose synthase
MSTDPSTGPIDLAEASVIVTGGAGFLGSRITRRLRERGVAELFVPRSADYDLTRQSDVARMYEEHPCEVVIHSAAVVGGIGANRRQPGTFYYRNLVMGAELIEQARQHRVKKFVAIGTTCSYPKLAPVPFREEDLWAGYPEETNAPYGIAKKVMSVQIEAYREEFGFQGIFLLPVNMYGPGDNVDLESSHVIPAMIRKFADAREEGHSRVTLWGDGSPTREFLYVEDAAEAIVLATERYDSPEPVNLGSGESISIADLALLVRDLVGFEGEIDWDTSKPNGQPRRQLDVSRAAETFGWRASTTLEAGLRKTIDWYLRSKEGATIDA